MTTLWLSAVAFAATCEATASTEQRFKPQAAEEADWGEPGGWDKSRFRGMDRDDKKLFKRYRTAFSAYPQASQDAILAGELRADLDEVALYLSWRAPAFVFPGEDKSCRRLLYVHDGLGALASTCDGRVEALHQIEAPLPCERLDQVLPRMERAKREVATWSAEQHVQVLLGVPDTWMGRDTLEMAFGKPEKKWNGGAKLRFSADSGIHEGPTVWLVDDLADAWTFPAATVLNKEGRKQERKAEKAERKGEAQEDRVAAARERRGGALRLLTQVAAIGAAAAVEAQGGPTTVSHTSSEYRNHQRLTCNGRVLYDKVFTSEASCRAEAARQSFDCNGVTVRPRC